MAKKKIVNHTIIKSSGCAPSSAPQVGRMMPSRVYEDTAYPDKQVEQIDDMLFGITNMHDTTIIVDIINWMNESELKYKMKSIPSYSGVFIKFFREADAVMFKMSCLDEITT